ncbi:MAG TPA: acyl carrier protein [Bacteroidales bacterium]|nr:acyl carrier protein [Bacteroidales bacterium]
MERTDVINHLTAIFKKVFEKQELVLTDEMTANDVDQWTSLSHVILIAEIEKEFSITFQMRDLNKMDNVGAMVDLIISKL